MSDYEVSVNGGVNDADVPLQGHLAISITQSPVIPNPEGTPAQDISTMEIDNVIYAVKDETARTELGNKVNKVEGKGLSTNDYTTDDKAIVNAIANAPTDAGYYTLDVHVTNNRKELYWRRLAIPSNSLYPSDI